MKVVKDESKVVKIEEKHPIPAKNFNRSKKMGTNKPQNKNLDREFETYRPFEIFFKNKKAESTEATK